METMHFDFMPFAKEVEGSETVEDVWGNARVGFEAVGFEFFVYLTVAPGFKDPFGLSNLPELFTSTPPAKDPFLHYCCDNYNFTYTGPDYLGDYAYLPETAKRFISAARDLGFYTGFGVPVRLRGSSRFGGFNLGTGLRRELFERKMDPLQHALRFFCLVVHRRIEELTQKSSNPVVPKFRSLLVAPETPVLDGLSAREQEVVYHVGQGLSRKECAQILGISHNTVSEYIKSAYTKLGVRNRVEAARKLNLQYPPI